MREVLRILIVGLIVGLLAKLLVPGHDATGFVGTILLGIGGSFVGGFVPRLFSPERAREPFSPAGFGGSVLGAIGLILLTRIF